MTREEWLEAAFRELETRFPALTFEPHRPRVSVGWAEHAHKDGVGWCYERACCEDGRPQIFIVPTMERVTGDYGVLGTLLHEMCHAALPDNEKHGSQFAVLAKQVGLEGKPTQTFAGPLLQREFETIAARLGPYPHSAIILADKEKQKNRHGKCFCRECGYICRTSNKWILEQGAPICPCNRQEMEVEDVEDDE